MTEDSGERRRITDMALDNLRRETDYRFQGIAQRFIAQEAATDVALAAAKEAIIKAELAQEERFNQVSKKIDMVASQMEKLTRPVTTFGYMIAAAVLVLSLVVVLANYGFRS